MGKTQFKKGDRVELKGFPFVGHTGTIRGRRRLGWLIRVWLVDMDQPRLGGTVVRVLSRDMRPLVE